MTNSVIVSSSTETCPLIKTGYLQPRSFMEAPPSCRIPFLLTVVHSLKSGNVRQNKLNSKLRQHSTQESITTYYNAHAHPLTEIEIGSNVAIQHPRTKLWDIYGIVTVISPNRRYYVHQNLQWSCASQKLPISTLQSTSLCTNTTMQLTIRPSHKTYTYTTSPFYMSQTTTEKSHRESHMELTLMLTRYIAQFFCSFLFLCN